VSEIPLKVLNKVFEVREKESEELRKPERMQDEKH
jgi:hypothetical protein